MQFSSIIVAAAAFALAQAAAITNTPGDFVGVATGKLFVITWGNATGPVSLVLKNGVATNLQTVSTIASGLSGNSGSFSWTPSSSLVSGQYAIEIDDNSGPNYSVQFAIAGTSSSSSSASSASSASSSSVSSSASTTSSGSSTSSSSSSSATGSSSSNSSSTTGSSSSSSASKTSSTSSSKTGSSTTSAPTSSSTVPSSSASNLSSPLALVLLAIAAFVSLN